MSSLLSLSNEQKAQVRNAFTLIDSESKDGQITVSDLSNIHKTLGLELPLDKVLKQMLNGADLISFAQFSQIIAEELSKLDDRTTITNALRVFASDENKSTLLIDVDELKEACCAVQLGEIGSGDHRLSRASFDSLVEGFVREQMDGKKMFNALNWISAYIE